MIMKKEIKILMYAVLTVIMSVSCSTDLEVKPEGLDAEENYYKD